MEESEGSRPRPGRQSLEDWTHQLSDRELPALAAVVQELNELTKDRDSIATQLAQVILRDPNLVTQVLKIANSVHYSRGNPPITTISRAVVTIGYEPIREICISIALVESLLGEKPERELLEIMAGSFHAAVQAKNLAAQVGDQGGEEVFVASLLVHVGELAFFSAGGPCVEEVRRLMVEHGLSREEAGRKVLGFPFADLSRSLARNWHFGGLIGDALSGSPKKGGVNAQAVRLGERISELSGQGWDAPGFDELVEEVAEFTGAKPEEIRKAIRANAEEAARVAITYGANKVCSFIPSGREPEARPAETKPARRQLQPDPALQLEVLREMSAMVAEGVDINQLFQTVLEGLHRGIGLERVAISLANARTGRLQCKYVLGDTRDTWQERFSFPCSRDAENLFAWVMHVQPRPVWLRKGEDAALWERVTPELRGVCGGLPCLVAPLQIAQRSVGVIYADSGPHGRELQESDFSAFQHFSLQTNMCLGILGGGR